MAHYDPQDAFDTLKRRVSSTIQEQFPIEGKKNTLTATKVWVDDTKSIDDIRTQQKVKLNERTWAVPVKAELELKDKATGKVKDRKVVTLAQLPKITNRYTYIVDGNEWQVNNQFRLKSGVYTHRKASGEIASQWNLAKGLNFGMDFNPKTRKMTMQFAGTGANVPLYPILKVMGVDDDTIERKWGKEVLTANMKDKSEVAIRKFYKAMTGEQAESLDQARDHIREALGKTELRPDSTKLTLGKPFKTVDGQALLAGSGKILNVLRGNDNPDDRDSLEFKDLLSAEDLVAERLEKKHKWNIRRKIGNNVDKQTKVQSIINPDIFGKPIKEFFSSSTLSERPDQLNPMTYISGNRRTTIMGEGGISKGHQVTESAKAINPSHLGFLDPIHTPESSKIGTTLQLSLGAQKIGKDLKIPVVNRKTGKTEQIDAGTALRSNLAYPDQYKKVDGKLVPIGPRVKISDSRGTTTTTKPGDVDYILKSPKAVFDLSSNLIPFLQNDQGNRTMVAARQIEQAVSLRDRESPLVQVKSEAPYTFERLIGGFTSHASPVDGVVEKVGRRGAVIKGKDGTKHEVQFYTNFPLNDDKSMLHSTPLVKAGDQVKKGQTVGDTNFTKDGELALGTNLRVAYMPWKGYNFEDGVVISESASKKMTSEHMFRSNITKEKNIILDKKKLIAEIGGVTPKNQMDKLDDEAVIKEGERVEPGDILIGALKKDEITPEKQQVSLFSKKLIKPVRAQTLTWEKDEPGVVTRVVKHGKNTTVYVRSDAPADVGDKIVGRHGNKGIVTCHDDQTEVLTENGWKLFKDLDPNERVCTLNPDTKEIEYHYPTQYIDENYSGRMYRYKGRRLDLFCTPEHKHYVRTRRGEFKLEQAEECFGLPRLHLRAGKWDAPDLEEVTIPGRPDGHKRHKKFCEPRTYDADLFIEFFGYWVTEGCISGISHIHIAQSKERNPEIYDRIVEVLYGLGYEPCLQPNTVVISDPRLHHWLKQFGKAKEKFIPRDLLAASKRQLRILSEAAFAGDGGEYYREKDNHTRHELFTSSKRLADDYQELALKIGFSANVKPQDREEGTEYVVRWTLKDEVWVNNDKRFDNESWGHYEGRIYCVTVPNHIVYVRRRGVPVWSGNSVLPDREMPKSKDGTHAEVLLNPTGVPGRINLGQVLETAASKIARKTGKPYVVNNFDSTNRDYTRNLKDELKKNGLSDTEELFDPDTGKSFGDVLFGDQYIYKLHHTAAKGLSVRSRDAYDSNMTPRGGGPSGAQTMDAAGLYAMLAHNARENIQEMQSYKSDMNDQFWAQLQAGDSVPTPKTPFVFKKFEGYLKSMGVDLDKQGNDLILQPLTDKKTLQMSSGRLTKPGLALVGRNLKPEPGGIFDPVTTGTSNRSITSAVLGNKWSHITLAEKMPNPVFETPARSLLGLSQKEYDRVIKSKSELDGKTGPSAIVSALKKVNVKKDKAKLEKELPNLRTTALNSANKKLKYLRALDRAGMGADEAYAMKHLPVLPPTMRPVGVLPNGSLNLDDINKLYTMIGNTNDQLSRHDSKVMPEEEAHPLRSELYDGLKSLTLTGSVNKGRHLNSIAAIISGKGAPKEGFFQRKVIGRRQDLSMRSTIVPEPAMSLDEVGIPRKAAKELFKPFVVARLTRTGMSPLSAQKQVKEDTFAAQKALENVVAERPLLLKRDPVLHKYGVQAFRPKLVEGKAIRIHPLATSGYNADFDGDKMSAFVPVSHKAVREASRMVPSNNLFNPSNGFLMFKPSHESMLGLYKLSEMEKGTAKKFKSGSEAARAVKDGKLSINDLISLDDIGQDFLKTAAAKKTTVGRLMIYNSLPKEMRDDKILTDPNFKLDNKTLNQVLSTVAANHHSDFGKVSDRFKNMGNENATGLSISLDDFLSDHKHRDKVLAAAAKEEHKILSDSRTSGDRKEEKVIALYGKAADEISKKAKIKADASKNRMYDWVRSGARGNWDQFRQITVAPMLVADSKGKTVPIPIGRSYSEGLDIGSYWAAMHGARMGTISKVEGTWRPGLASKQVMQGTMNQVIVSEDCKTTKGISFSADDKNILNRYTIGDVKLGTRGGKDKGSIPSGTLVTPDVMNRLKNNKVQSVVVRSPLKCIHGKGMCSKCYGLNEKGQLHEKGSNVGVIAAHSLGEPSTQLAMKVFHTGGVVGAKETGARSMFDRLDQLLNLPKTLPGAATISHVDGKIDQVQKDPAAGGWNVMVQGQKHYVPGSRNLLAKKGMDVKRGDALSSGPKNPREMLPLVGLNHVQSYLVKEIQDTYGNEAPLSRRNTETFVRSLTNLAEVSDPGDHPNLLRGDKVPASEVKEYNRLKGTQSDGRVKYRPILTGVKMLPLETQEDWMARLQSTNLRKTIIDAASEGWRSVLHGTHPIPGMAVGSTFGTGTKDEPWLY